MGQARDEDGLVLGEAFAELKKEVFEELNTKFPDAHTIKVQKITNENELLKERLRDYSNSGEQIFKDSLKRIIELEREVNDNNISK